MCRTKELRPSCFIIRIHIPISKLDYQLICRIANLIRLCKSASSFEQNHIRHFLHLNEMNLNLLGPQNIVEFFHTKIKNISFQLYINANLAILATA